MSVAHDLNDLDEQKRKDAALKLVAEKWPLLYALRLRSSEMEAGDVGVWQAARQLAQDTVRAATPLDLGLLAACAKEVLQVTESFFAAGTRHPDLVLHLLSTLDTFGMELERLEHDKSLK